MNFQQRKENFPTEKKEFSEKKEDSDIMLIIFTKKETPTIKDQCIDVERLKGHRIYFI